MEKQDWFDLKIAFVIKGFERRGEGMTLDETINQIKQLFEKESIELAKFTHEEGIEYYGNPDNHWFYDGQICNDQDVLRFFKENHSKTVTTSKSI